MAILASVSFEEESTIHADSDKNWKGGSSLTVCLSFAAYFFGAFVPLFNSPKMPFT